jgi:hypothetical protein
MLAGERKAACGSVKRLVQEGAEDNQNEDYEHQ